MKRLTTFFVTVILSFLTLSESQGQCSAQAEWTFDPAPVDGFIPAGTNVEICVDLQLFSHGGGGGWLFGMELDFPDTWQMATLNVISTPQTCSSNGGEWAYLDVNDCPMFNLFGPGFYYDGNSDDNFCNNWGDYCPPTGANHSFCFEITLGNGTNGENILPRIRVLSDGEISVNWINPCPFPIVIEPSFPFLLLSCNDVSAGVSPGPLAICESQCLLDLLEGADEGGVWTGPDGYIDSLDCGYFDVNTNSLGDYSYTVTGNCSSMSTITVVESDLGIVFTELICTPTTNLNNFLNGEYPYDGTWYDPLGNIIPNGNVDFETTGYGLFQFQFTALSGCLMTLEINLPEGFDIPVPASTNFCNQNTEFCPFDVFQSLQPPDIEIYHGGQWLLYSDQGYLDFFSETDLCLSAETMLSYGSNLEFTYIYGAAPCTPVLTSLYVNIGSINDSISEIACDAVINLMDYLPGFISTGGFWTDNSGNSIPPQTLAEYYPLGSTQIFHYNSISTEGCSYHFTVELFIQDPATTNWVSNYNYCGDGDVLDLATLLPANAANQGEFSPTQEILLLVQNSGAYTYTSPDMGCGEMVYTFNLNIIGSLSYSNLTYSFLEDSSAYIVTFAITGGTPPYMVSGGIITGNTFTSLPISADTQYNFVISDSGVCPDIIITGSANDCTVSAGESPGALAICQSETFCLFNELANADSGGVWSGPDGYVDSLGCGYFEVGVNSLGVYTYTVSANDCTSSSTITVIAEDLGIVSTGLLCVPIVDLNAFLPNEYPSSGTWYDPDGNELQDGLVENDTSNVGLYTYQFYSASGCLTSLQMNVVLDPNVMLPVSTTYCGAEDFCPFNVFQSLQPDGSGYPTSGGGWILYDGEGFYLNYNPDTYWCLSAETMLSYGSNLVFTYILGAFPCAPWLIDLTVTIETNVTEQEFACVPLDIIDLNSYLTFLPIIEGIWTNSNGDTIPSLVDFSIVEPESVHTYSYYYTVDSGCESTFQIELTTIGFGAGSDQIFDLCATGEEIYLDSLLEPNASINGSFNTSNPYILANTGNSGDYIYSVNDSVCGNQSSATYTINFISQMTSEVESICNTDGTTFNVYLEISGGTPPYQINGETFTSSSIELLNLPVSQNVQTILVEDSGPCGVAQINVSVPDSDADGVCDSQEIAGCMDPEASNYNPNATDPGNCFYTPGDPEMTLSEAGVPIVGKPGNGFGFGNGLNGNLKLSMYIFPNPAGDEVNFEITGLSSENGILEIRDILGSVLYSKSITSINGRLLTKIDLKGFSSGIYLVRLVDDRADVVTRLVIGR